VNAELPPEGLAGFDHSWSRLVRVPSIDGVGRTWHLLDHGPSDARLTLLCVHGNPSWSYLFRGLVAAAPDDVRVIAVDQLEMGFSERSGRCRRLATRIDDLGALTDELGLTGPVVTVAHDWGGPVSLGWALRHREQLAGVVLMNTAVHQPAGSPAPSIIRLVRSRPMLRAVTVRTDAFIRGALWMNDRSPSTEVRRGFLAPYRSADRRQAIGEFVADIPLDDDHPSAAALDQVAAGLADLADVPALLVWGSADLVFSDLYLHDLERRLPHADVHRHPNAGHFVSEDVDAFGAVVDWIGTLGHPRSTTASDEPSSLASGHGGFGNRTAVAEPGGVTVDFDEFDRRVASAATALLDVGVQPGQRVALMIPPGVDLAVVLYACWRIGAVIVLVDAGLGPRGMSAAVASANPDHLVGIPRAIAAARVLRWPGRRIGVTTITGSTASGGSTPPPPHRDDPAAVVFTSGATGPSKGVAYAHRQLEAQRDALVDLYGITGDDRLVAAFAPFALYGPAIGIPSIVPDMDVTAPGSLTAEALGDAAVAIDATMVFASPAALANVVRTADGLTDEHRRAFRRVRLLLSAGAPVRESLLRSAAALFPNAQAHTPYGMTECLPVADIDLEGLADSGSAGGDGVCVGRPVRGVDVVIHPLDALGRPTGAPTTNAGVIGEVVVRAPHARSGYDRLWHTGFAASPDPGWHATGDVGHLDTAGRLWIGGRIGHVISTPSGPVTPVSREHAIEGLDGVTAAAVVGVGPAGSQQIVAVVEGTDTRVADHDLTRRVREIAGSDIAAVLEVPRLPVDRRHNSKVDRTLLAGWADAVLRGGRLRPPVRSSHIR
jgi:acyl-CoA synthetase (AMP-forming)/AMP-acid ligase II/pimeloyl-ACP methyl ester carboxylesterase